MHHISRYMLIAVTPPLGIGVIGLAVMIRAAVIVDINGVKCIFSLAVRMG